MLFPYAAEQGNKSDEQGDKIEIRELIRPNTDRPIRQIGMAADADWTSVGRSYFGLLLSSVLDRRA